MAVARCGDTRNGQVSATQGIDIFSLVLQRELVYATVVACYDRRVFGEPSDVRPFNGRVLILPDHIDGVSKAGVYLDVLDLDVHYYC